MAAKIDTGRARKRSCTERDKHVESDPPNRKRRRGAESTDTSTPTRQSPRSRERREWNQPRVKRGGNRTRFSTRTYRCIRQQSPQAERRIPIASKLRHGPRDEEGRPEASLTNPETQNSRLSPLSRSVATSITDLRVVKRRRSVQDGDLSNHGAKLPKRHDTREQRWPRLGHGKHEFIESWLSTSGWPRRASPDNGKLVQGASEIRPPKPIPSPCDSRASTASVSSSKASRGTEKSAASTRDTDYRESLEYRNIYIECEVPPVELMRRSEIIISRSRASPEMDDDTAEELRKTARRLQNGGEEDIVQELATHIIPAMVKLTDPRLARSADQLWSNYVPVPPHPVLRTKPLSLPQPKPDLAFGYSKAAFNPNQRETIRLLVDDASRRSYAIPDKKLRFPFLVVEFKSQATNGTPYIARNQVAGTGAAALRGHLELIRRNIGMEKYDYNEPYFFSVIMDHELVRVNVHWVSPPAEGGQHRFHVEGLPRYYHFNNATTDDFQRSAKY